MATQEEIARYVGVNISTVSKILNGKTAPYREETVRKVRRAAKHLGYDPKNLLRNRKPPPRRIEKRKSKSARPTQEEIARLTGLDLSTVNKILKRKVGPTFRKETIRRVFRAARDLGYDIGGLKHEHRRAFPRREVRLPVEISIYRRDGTLFDRGSATLRDVSLSGAVLRAVALPQDALPLRPHTIGLRLLEGPLKGTEILGRVIRFSHERDEIALAIEFLEAQELDLERLRKIV